MDVPLPRVVRLSCASGSRRGAEQGPSVGDERRSLFAMHRRPLSALAMTIGDSTLVFGRIAGGEV